MWGRGTTYGFPSLLDVGAQEGACVWLVTLYVATSAFFSISCLLGANKAPEIKNVGSVVLGLRSSKYWLVVVQESIGFLLCLRVSPPPGKNC